MPQDLTSTDKIIECLKEQKEHYARLLVLAHNQKQAIDGQDDQALLKALADKNPVLQTLQELENNLQELLNKLTESEKDQVIEQGKPIKDEIAQSLGQLIAVEEACAKILQDKKDETFEQMKVFQEHQKGMKGYGDNTGPAPRISRKG